VIRRQRAVQEALLVCAQRPATTRSGLPFDAHLSRSERQQLLKTFQRGKAEVLRSVSPELVRQEIWAHLALHHCLNRIIMRLANGEGLDPDRISFVKVLKHTRRSVVLQAGRSIRQLRQFMTRMATKVVRKLDNGLRRLRAADRCTRRPISQYVARRKNQVRHGTRRVSEKVITLVPAILQ
jgi:hypothetical protein